MNVADLFASFGFDTDFGSIAKVHSALSQVEQHAKQAADAAKLSTALTHVHGDSDKALALIGLNADAAKTAMAGATKSTFSWSRAIVVANQALGIGLKLYGGVANAIGRVRGLAEATGAQASQAIELSMQLGVSAEAIQELGFASTQSGGSIEVMTVGLRTLSNQAQNAAKGGKDAARAFRDVGLNAKDVTSGKVPLDQALGKIADTFQAMPDGAKKSALAVDLFGRQGTKLIPLLNEGAAGVGRLRQEARDLGYVIDNEAAAALEGFGDETDKVKAQIDGVRNQAITALLPALSELVKGLQAWIKANRQLLVSSLTAGLRVLVTALKVVGAVAAHVINVIGFFIEHSTLAIALLAALGAAFAVMGVIALKAWIMALSPAALVAAAIIAIILLMPLIVKAVKAAGRTIGMMLDGIRRDFIGVGRDIENVFRSIGRFFEGIGRGIQAAWGAVFDWIDARIESVKRAARDVTNWLRDNVPGASSLLGPKAAAAPQATLSSGRTASMTTVHSAPTFNITPGPDVNTEQLGAIVNDHIDRHWQGQIVDAAAGLGVG